MKLTFEDDFDLLNGELLTKSSENMSDLSAHDGAVSFLVEDSETLDEVLEGTILLLLGAELDVVDELVEVAGLVLLVMLAVSRQTLPWCSSPPFWGRQELP